MISQEPESPPLARTVGLICALAFAGCTVDAPIAHRADVLASYESK